MSHQLVNKPLLRLLRIHPRTFSSVFDQLVFEENLFRQTSENWCILSQGQPSPTIIMGLSGKPDKLLDVEKCRKEKIDIVKRFSGGGTVVTDLDTAFVSWVCNKAMLPKKIAESPPALMKWSAELYKPVLQDILRNSNCSTSAGVNNHQDIAEEKRGTYKNEILNCNNDNIGSFNLQEHDYCLGLQKFGGNAQCLTKDRFVHHTSFLWNFQEVNMTYLRMPEKRPEYRKDREHLDFLVRLCDATSPEMKEEGPSVLFDAVTTMARRVFNIIEMDVTQAQQMLKDAPKLNTNAAAIRTRNVIL